MNRLEKFRYIRNIRRRNRLAVVLSFLLLFSGILVADSSMNRLMNRESGPGWFTWHLTGHPLLYKIS